MIPAFTQAIELFKLLLKKPGYQHTKGAIEE